MEEDAREIAHEISTVEFSILVWQHIYIKLPYRNIEQSSRYNHENTAEDIPMVVDAYWSETMWGSYLLNIYDHDIISYG